MALISEMGYKHAYAEFNPMDDFPDQFSDKIETKSNFDPANVETTGDFAQSTITLANKFAETIFRTTLPPERARVPSFHIEFSEPAPRMYYRPPLRLAPKYDEALRISIDDLLKQHIDIACHTNFASLIAMTNQKDKIRMCIDYREINSVTLKMRYPLPNPAVIFQSRTGNKYFGHMNLLSGYHLLSMPEVASNWSAFVTPWR